MQNENIAKVGDFIRAYDFKPMINRNDCFVEGIVEQVNCTEPGYKCYKITVVTDVFDGKKRKGVKTSRIGKMVFVPYQVSFMEYPGRIINIT